MDAEHSPLIDADLPELLRRLAEQAAGSAGEAAALAQIGAQRALQATTLVGAMAIGGVALASRLVAHEWPDAGADEQTGLLLQALDLVLTPAPGDDGEHEAMMALTLATGFGLSVPPAALFDLIRADFLIDRGPVSELPAAVKAAMDHAQWALALRGIERQRRALADLDQALPRSAFGQAALCLHRLGRFEEAEAWAREGMDRKQAALITIPPVRSEAELLMRWGDRKVPVVSILCTTYNHERYVESAIRGFLSQDCTHPFEILIHDDASTDLTQRVIRAWQQRYPSIIKPVLQTVNQMSRGARPIETLLARAQGGFIATCEGDDYWVDPAKLQRQVDYLITHPDVSCTAHNYHHFVESSLTVRPWRRPKADFAITPRQLMAVRWLLWMPTLVFRKTFSTLPPERAMAAFGDQFLTSYLGTLGRGMYFETMFGAVRRENQFSSWSPLPETEKERRRVKTWAAMIRMHERLGHPQAVNDLLAKVAASPLQAAEKALLLAGDLFPQALALPGASSFPLPLAVPA